MRQERKGRGILTVLAVSVCLFLCWSFGKMSPFLPERGELPDGPDPTEIAEPSETAETAKPTEPTEPSESPTVPHRHVFNILGTRIEPTCRESGIEFMHCLCGEMRYQILPAVHTPVLAEEIPAQLGVPGLRGRIVCAVCGEELDPGVEIPALTPEDLSWTVTVQPDEALWVLEPGSLTECPVYLTTDETGGYTREGGSVSFVLAPRGGFVADRLVIEGQYEAWEELAGGLFRITGIGSDLSVLAYGREIPVLHTADPILAHIGSQTDENGLITFWWDLLEEAQLISLTVLVKTGDETERFDIPVVRGEWRYQLPENERVSFEFTPYGAEREGENLRVSRMFAPAAALTGMPRVEIVTEDGFFPDADTIKAPAGSFGVGITNLNELAALIRIYSGTGEMIFDSGAGFGLEDLFRGAEVKLRGNTSGTMEKAPYRIRLAERADLLAELIPGRKESGVFYENRSWALLATGDRLNQVVGSAVAGLVGMETVCAFRYVSLYFNGDFRGVYLLAELVDQGAGTEETQSRVRVADSGFIAEADAYWWNHEFSLKTPLLNGSGFRYTVKFPDDLTEDDPRLEPIRQALTDLENAIRTGSSRLGEAADLESFAAWLLAHDYLGTADAAGSNLYVSRRDDSAASRIRMGPMWDFDSVCLRVGGWGRIHTFTEFYFTLLTQREDFTRIYRRLFEKTNGLVWQKVSEALQAVDSVSYDAALSLETLRWGWPVKLYAEQAEEFETFFGEHLAWLRKYVGDDSVFRHRE